MPWPTVTPLFGADHPPGRGPSSCSISNANATAD